MAMSVSHNQRVLSQLRLAMSCRVFLRAGHPWNIPFWQRIPGMTVVHKIVIVLTIAQTYIIYSIYIYYIYNISTELEITINMPKPSTTGVKRKLKRFGSWRFFCAQEFNMENYDDEDDEGTQNWDDDYYPNQHIVHRGWHILMWCWLWWSWWCWYDDVMMWWWWWWEMTGKSLGT